jgi:nucleotide-binding universal stress UspA family protein
VIVGNQVYKTILVGADGTPEAGRALHVAILLARSLKARAVVLGVIPPASPESQAEGYGLEIDDAKRSRMEQALRQEIQALGNAEGEVTLEICGGRPDETILRKAAQYDADLIVVGRRDVSRIRHWLEGSTSESLVRKCVVSLLVVPDTHA